jgi:ABC-type sugar transport system permease subunit
MNIFRTVFYLPSVLSGVAISLMWIWILHPDLGVVNGLLDLVGLKGPGWFWDPAWALPSVVLMRLWGVGGGAVIYLAGLQNIPPHLYEAAAIDGAGRRRQFWSIALPLLTPTLFFQGYPLPDHPAAVRAAADDRDGLPVPVDLERFHPAADLYRQHR